MAVSRIIMLIKVGQSYCHKSKKWQKSGRKKICGRYCS